MTELCPQARSLTPEHAPEALLRDDILNTVCGSSGVRTTAQVPSLSRGCGARGSLHPEETAALAFLGYPEILLKS